MSTFGPFLYHIWYLIVPKSNKNMIRELDSTYIKQSDFYINLNLIGVCQLDFTSWLMLIRQDCGMNLYLFLFLFHTFLYLLKYSCLRVRLTVWSLTPSVPSPPRAPVSRTIAKQSIHVVDTICFALICGYKSDRIVDSWEANLEHDDESVKCPNTFQCVAVYIIYNINYSEIE
jgi:hypothetical protein